MRVALSLPGGEIVFSPEHDLEGPYPYLVAIGTLRIAARAGRLAGLGVGESPSLEVQLQNAERQVADTIGLPFRAPTRVLNDDGSVFFDGIVSKITLGKVITLTLES